MSESAEKKKKAKAAPKSGTGTAAKGDSKPATAAKAKSATTKAKPATAKAKPAASGGKSRSGTAAKVKAAKNTAAAKAKPSSTKAAKSEGAAKARKAPAKRTTRASDTSAKKATARKKAASRVQANPVAAAANRKSEKAKRSAKQGDLFLEKSSTAKKPAKSGGEPPRPGKRLFGALNACLAVAIALIVALGLRQHVAYADFLRMREVVDQQTFYDGTTIEGVDVSNMTLSNAMDYWRDKVEARYANRTVTLDNGMTVTAQELGYNSDYESVLSAAWSAGRNGSLEERYRMASIRQENPVAYDITRTDTTRERVDDFAQLVAVQVDQPALDAEVAEFNPDTFEFTFTESQVGRKLDSDALKRDVVAAIENGGGNVSLSVEELPPAVSTDEVTQKYGLIDYAITNANSSSKARINNIKLAMSFINGTRLAPGETFSFNETVGQRTASRGFKKATAYSGGDVTEEIGGGICQVSTTLFNAAVKADMKIEERHNHSLTVSYVDKGKDATVDWGHQDFKFTNTSEDDVFICCYLTDDKRVRFGIFGRLLPNGEKITLEARTTEVIKYETEYQATPLLAHGATNVLQPGRNGYKAEAYKVRWDANGNELSRELLCKSIYKVKNEIVQYGA